MKKSNLPARKQVKKAVTVYEGKKKMQPHTAVAILCLIWLVLDGMFLPIIATQFSYNMCALVFLTPAIGLILMMFVELAGAKRFNN
jgi:hypothetical protein